MNKILKFVKSRITLIRQKKEFEISNNDNNGLGEYLIEKGIITEMQLKEALDYQVENSNKKIGEILYEIDILGDNEILVELAEYMKVDYVFLHDRVYPLNLQKRFSKKIMIEELFVPFELSGNVISIAISDINNVEFKEKIEKIVKEGDINYYVVFYLSLPTMIKNFIYNSYAKHPHHSDVVGKRKKFGQYLIEKHIISQEQLDEVIKYQRKFIHKRMGEILSELKILDREKALKELAIHEGREYITLEDKIPQEDLIKLFDYDEMDKNYFVPFALENKIIKIAINNIFDDEYIDQIKIKLEKQGLDSRFYIAMRDSIEHYLQRAIF